MANPHIHTLVFPEETLNQNSVPTGDSWQLKIVFTVNEEGTNSTDDAVANHVDIKNHGKAKWELNMDESLFMPGESNIVLCETGSYLYNALFGTDSHSVATDKKFEAKIYLNAVLEYSGYVVEDSIVYVEAEKTLSFSLSTPTDILSTTNLFTDDNIPTDPFDYAYAETEGSEYVISILDVHYDSNNKIVTIFHPPIGSANSNFDTGRLVKIFGVTGMTDLNASWQIKDKLLSPDGSQQLAIKISLMTDQTYTGGGTIVNFAYDKVNYPVAYSDFIGKCFGLINPSLSTGDESIQVSHNWLFHGVHGGSEYDFNLKDIYFLLDNYYFDPNIGAKSVIELLKAMALELISYVGMINNEQAFFKRLYYYDPTDEQTISNVLTRKMTYQQELTTAISVKDMEMAQILSDAQTIYYLPSRNVFSISTKKKEIQTYLTFYDYAGGSGGSLSAYRGGDEYSITSAKDSTVCNDYKPSFWLIANAWYSALNKLGNFRTDEMTVNVVTVHPTKCFIFSGCKYQPIYVEKDWENHITTIKAIFLGLDS